ncbi:acyl-CoA thioesterase [bacterium]|nr:acyl-CoA thioesterase [bacterium]
MFGGKVMAIMDIQAGIVASQYCRKTVVTASTEAVDFKNPVRVGDRIETISRVVFVGRTSLVVKIDAYAENPLSGKRKHCTTAYFNMVALDEDGVPTAIPPLIVETEDEKREFRIAEHIKQDALERKKKIREEGGE